MAFLDGYKTYIIGVLGVLVGLAELVGLDVVPGIDKTNAAQFIMNGALAATFRSALAKFISG